MNSKDQQTVSGIDKIATQASSKDEQVKDQKPLQELNIDQLVEMARNALLHNPAMALEQLAQIKPLVVDLAGKDESFDKQILEQLDLIIQTAEDAHKEEKNRIEAEKQTNYKKKKDLLDALKRLNEEDETESSINDVKNIQREWKEIKVLPTNKVQELWDAYHRLLDSFYDKHSINIELKDLDRKKNLEAKIELTKKVEELVNEKSLKHSYILLNKFHEEFRNIGPIPKESREGIWQAFKAASDHIYTIKNAERESINSEREANLKLKALLVEKVNVIAQVHYDSTKDWNKQTKAIEQIFEEWKKVGPVPRAKSDSIWTAFKTERNTFYANRKLYFSGINSQRTDNLKKKEALCVKAEELKDNEDLQATTKAILALQTEWKKIGPVPDKFNQSIWKRFRAACDHFFSRKEAMFAGQRDEENKNLEIKKDLIKQLEALAKNENESEVFPALKQIASTWRSTGFIPRKDVKKINTRYDKLSDELFKKFKKDKGSLKAEEWEDHYAQIAQSPNGFKRLKDQEYGLKKRLNHLQSDILTLETNMSFFSKSSNADSLLKDFTAKLNKAKAQKEQVAKEVKVIQKVKRSID